MESWLNKREMIIEQGFWFFSSESNFLERDDFTSGYLFARSLSSSYPQTWSLLSDFTHRDLLRAMVGFKKGKDRHLVEVQLLGFDHLGVFSLQRVLERQNLADKCYL